MQDLILLGATGSIGKSTCDLVRRYPEQFRIVAASAHSQGDALAELAHELDIAKLALVDADAAHAFASAHPDLRARLCGSGEAGLLALLAAKDAMVVNGLVGAAGLRPTVRALELGLDVALANKEALVVGGQLVLNAAAQSGARIWPVDSEHSAIAQCLRGNPRSELSRIWLTASGGPFRDRPPHSFDRIELHEVLDHPTWKMGPKITVDSATMMNKGLEVLEAHLLFALPLSQIDIVIHRQSIVHSMVEFRDGSFLAQLGAPDMRIPILYAISRGEHRPCDVAPFDPVAMGRLDFEAPDPRRYPCLALARQAAEVGGAASIVLNAANEVAVGAVLASELPFVGIAPVIESCLADPMPSAIESVDAALACDAETRSVARERIRARASSHG